MKAGVVAALVGSAAAAVHQNHQGFHLRREAPKDDCKVVYTTVYVTASPPGTFKHSSQNTTREKKDFC